MPISPHHSRQSSEMRSGGNKKSEKLQRTVRNILMTPRQRTNGPVKWFGENFWKVRNSSGKLPSLKIRTLPPENVPISVSIVAGQIPICYAPCGIRDTRARALYILRLTVLFPTRNGECEWRKRNQWSFSDEGKRGEEQRSTTRPVTARWPHAHGIASDARNS